MGCSKPTWRHSKWPINAANCIMISATRMMMMIINNTTDDFKKWFST
jgi:hypothetical protein